MATRLRPPLTGWRPPAHGSIAPTWTGTVEIRTDGTTFWVVGEGRPLFLPLIMAGHGAPVPTSTPSFTATWTATPTATVCIPTTTPTATPTATATATTWFVTSTPTPTRTLTPTATTVPQSDLRITYLRYDTSDEYVKISNYGGIAQNMTGWWIHSETGNQKYYFPGGYVLPAGDYVRIHSGPGAISNPPHDLKWSGAYIWNNAGDAAALYDSAGHLVDRWSY